MKNAKGTHRPMGKKGGATAGIESGLSDVQKYKAGQGVDITEKSQRPKAASLGTISTK